MLTEKQKTILNATYLYIQANGISPTIRNICNLVGVRSSSTVHTYLNNLEKEGFITKQESIPRSIVITGKGLDLMK